MSTSWISIQAGSHRRITTTVRTVFRCVASRNRKKETLAKKKQPSSAEQHPAPGYRHPSYGTLYSVGVYGFSWSSTASGSNAHNLGFSYGGVGPQNSDGRAFGFQLRCLQG
jgi:hypothetical protein